MSEKRKRADDDNEVEEIEDTHMIDYARGYHGPLKADACSIFPGQESRVGYYECYVCDNPLFHKKGVHRKRNGIASYVPPYFFHTLSSFSSSFSATCTREKTSQAAAKDALMYYMPELDVIIKCTTCSEPIHVDIFAKDQLCKKDWGWEWQGKRYVLDVANVCPKTGQVMGAVVLGQCYAMDEDMAAALTESGLAWCEVTVSDVLAQYAEPGHRIQARRAAVGFCKSCTQHMQEESQQKFKNECNAYVDRHLAHMRSMLLTKCLIELGFSEEEAAVITGKDTSGYLSNRRYVTCLAPERLEEIKGVGDAFKADMLQKGEKIITFLNSLSDEEVALCKFILLHEDQQSSS